MNRAAKKITTVFMTMALSVGSVSSLGVSLYPGTEVATAAGKVSLKSSSGKLSIHQDGKKITKKTAQIRIKKAKGVRIKKTTYQVEDSAVVKVDKKGKVTPKAMGATTVSVNVKYLYRSRTKTKKLTYKVKVDQSYKHILSGLTMKYKTYATFVDGAEGINPFYDTTVVMPKEFFAWDCLTMSVADPSVAEVGKDGLVIGRQPGTTTVTIRSTDDTDLSVTATLKVFATRGELTEKNDLFNTIRAEYIPALEKGWTEEDKERYIDEDGKVLWSLSTMLDYQLSDGFKKIVETYSTIEKQPDGTPGDALNSLLTTADAMKKGGEAAEEAFINTVREKVVAPILDAKTIDELIVVSEDLVKRGMVGFLKCSSFQRYQNNYDVVKDVFGEDKRPPQEPVDTDVYYRAKVSLPVDMAGYDFSTKENAEVTKKVLKAQYKMLGFGTVSSDDMKAYVKFLKEFSDAYNEDSEGYWYDLKTVDDFYPRLHVKEHLVKKGYQVTDDDLASFSARKALYVLDTYLSKKKNLKILKMYLADAATYPLLAYSRSSIRIPLEASSDGDDQKTIDEQVEYSLEKQLSDIRGLIPWDMDHLYTGTYYPPGFKTEFSALVKKFLKAYQEAISSSSYGETFKANMLKKIDKMKTYDLYPDDDTYKKYELPYDLVTAAEGGSFAENLLKIFQYYADLECMTIGRKAFVDWWFPLESLFENMPSENNAFYDPRTNSAAFPYGGIGVNGLFYSNPDKSPMIEAKNLGFLSTTIGHELGHAFDNNGCKSNADGWLADPWGSDDPTQYNKKVEKLAQIYGTLLMYADREENKAYYQDGKNVVDEAMADLGGTEIALRILKEEFPGRDDLIREFYRYTAIQWMTTEEDWIFPGEIKSRVENVHPFSRERTNGVASMMDDYYRVFEVSEADAMYVAPEDRVVLWS